MAFDFPIFSPSSSNNIYPMVTTKYGSMMNASNQPTEITEISKTFANPAPQLITVAPNEIQQPQPMMCQPVLPQPIFIKSICPPPPPPPQQTIVCRPVVCQQPCQPCQPTVIKNIIRERAVPTVSDFRRPRRSCSQVCIVHISVYFFLLII